LTQDFTRDIQTARFSDIGSPTFGLLDTLFFFSFYLKSSEFVILYEVCAKNIFGRNITCSPGGFVSPYFTGISTFKISSSQLRMGPTKFIIHEVTTTPSTVADSRILVHCRSYIRHWSSTRRNTTISNSSNGSGFKHRLWY